MRFDSPMRIFPSAGPLGHTQADGRPRPASARIGERRGMTVLTSMLDPGGDAYAERRAAMLAKLAELDAEHAKAVAGGGPKYVDRHRGRGKLPARERIELLLDPDAPFLELSPLAAWGSDFTVGASVVSGIGVVEGVECVIVASDPTVRGGSSNPWTVAKSFRAADIALENRLPLINLVESGGADLPTQKEIFIPGGRIFRDLTRLSAAGIPTIALVFGNSTAGGAYLPGMSDYVVMVKERAKVFLGGPPLVKMATGEESGDEELGGAEMHAAYQRPGRLHGRRRARRAAHRPPDRRPPRLAQAGPRAGRARDRPALRRGRTARHRPRGPEDPLRPARGHRPDRRRVGLRRVQAALRHQPRHRLGGPARLPDRRPGQRPRRAVRAGVAKGRAVHPAREPDRHAAALPAEHHRLHGRQASTSRAASSSTAR